MLNVHCNSDKLIWWFKVERERSDLTVQLIGLTERLEEAEGSSESVVRNIKNWLSNRITNNWFGFKVEMNKKRDSELAKLRKLLEDVHLESEETAHHLRQKHQAAIAEMQDQMDQVQKAKNK